MRSYNLALGSHKEGLGRKTVFAILPQLETFLSTFHSLVLLIKKSIHMLSVLDLDFLS